MKKVYMGILVLLAVISMVGCGKTESEEQKVEQKYQSVSMGELEELLNTEENSILVDVRTEEEFAQGHIPGAICIPNETIGDNAISELPDEEQTVFVYCRSGNRSKQAAAKLAALGYSNIVESGGILDWDGELEE